MGQIIFAKCHNCDFENEKLYFGTGDLDSLSKSLTRCRYPALTPDKSDIVMADIGNRSKYEKLGFIFYDSEEMYEKDSKTEKCAIERRGHKIYIARYYCPKCKKFALSFHDCGCWD